MRRCMKMVVAAAAPQVTHFTFVEVTSSRQYSHLLLESEVTAFSGAGTSFSVDMMADVTDGFSFIEDSRLNSASLVAQSLPVTVCTATGDTEPQCEPGTAIDVALTWTGTGTLARGGSNDRIVTAELVAVSHTAGTFRTATAAGSIAGVEQQPDAAMNAVMWTNASGQVTVCFIGDCSAGE